jgi:hypothetical protein
MAGHAACALLPPALTSSPAPVGVPSMLSSASRSGSASSGCSRVVPVHRELTARAGSSRCAARPNLLRPQIDPFDRAGRATAIPVLVVGVPSATRRETAWMRSSPHRATPSVRRTHATGVTMQLGSSQLGSSQLGSSQLGSGLVLPNRSCHGCTVSRPPRIDFVGAIALWRVAAR